MSEGWPSFEEREVIDKARALVAKVKLGRAISGGRGHDATPEMNELQRAVEALDGDAMLLGHMPSGAPLYVGLHGPTQEPVTVTTPEQVRELFGYPVPPLGEPTRPFRPVSCGYEPTEETDEP